MERLKVLISNLQDQLNQQEEPSKMLLTVQLIQAELMYSVQHIPQNSRSSKVAVIMPQYIHHISSSEKKEEEVKESEKKYIVNEIEPLGEMEETEEMKLIEKDLVSFDPMIVVPTLFHQKEFKEINEKAPAVNESLNDRLRQSKIELGEVLKESPVKDLKKAIGINDRFTFINELFRGDESMYERSIKTINSFNIYAEAEYWINRELIVKIGWDIHSETVNHFIQIVKRRFS